MKIEITEKGPKEFYRETVSTLFQYRSLLRKPDKHLDDFIQSLSIFTFLDILLIIAMVLICIFWGKDTFSLIIIGCSCVIILISILFIFQAKKLANNMYENASPSSLTIDSEGVELAKQDTRIKLKWENVALVKIQYYSICFIPKDNTGIIISVSSDYKDDILRAIDELNNEEIKVY